MGSDISLENIYRTLESINEGIILYNSEKIFWINSYLVKLLGYDSANDFVGKNILSFIAADNIQHGTAQISKLYEGQRMTGGVYKVKKKDGSFRTVVTHGSVIQNLDDLVLISFVRPIENEPSSDILGVTVPMLLHEAATSLTVIRGYLDFLRNNSGEDSDAVRARYFDIIEQNIQRIEETLLNLK